jgi:hypothetical protein
MFGDDALQPMLGAGFEQGALTTKEADYVLWSVLSRGIDVSTSHSVRRGNSGVCKGRPSYVDHRSRDGGSAYVAGSDRECTVNFGGIAGLHCLHT